MITIRRYSIADYEELVKMHYEFISEIYSDRKIGYMYSFYKMVDEWMSLKKDIVVAEYKGKLIGYTVAHVDAMGGLTEPVYNGEIAYVREKYRKGRASYLLYKNVVDYAKENGLKVVSSSRLENGVDKMVMKHFNAKPKYITMEGE
jgi:GNAT superfamily N-acetyltransferase